VVKTVHLTSLEIPTGYSITVRGSTVQWPLFTFHSFEHCYFQYQYFPLNRSASKLLCPMCTMAGSWFLSIFLPSSGCFLYCNGAVLCLLPHLLLVFCPLCHHYFFNRMRTTYCTVALLYYHYLCCCVASCYKYSFFFLFGALCTYLSRFCPLCCCIASATASLFPEQLPPARKCQQHEMNPPRNRRMINV
jgi:hypothetical protein